MGGKRLSGKLLSPLGWPEKWLYFTVVAGSVYYMLYCVYRDSYVFDGILNLYDFSEGWGIIGKDQDISNFEWHFWFSKFVEISPWYLGHIALCKLTEWHSIKSRKIVYTVYSVLALCKLVGWQSVVVYVAHLTAMYISSFIGNTLVVWMMSLALLSTLNLNPLVAIMKSVLDDDKEETKYYLLMFTLALSNIRSTSFCIEKCWHQKTQHKQAISPDPDEMYREREPADHTSHLATSHSSHLATNETSETRDTIREAVGYSYTDILFYVLYLPLFFTGPILTYDLFKAQINNTPSSASKHTVLSLSLHLLRFVLWAYFIEFMLHFMYFNAIQNSFEVLKKVPLFTLAGLGYCHGQFFMMKYFVMFGYPGTIAKFDELRPPDPPKCITYIYLYSDMWKYFDRGLYNFLKRYIYVPCGGSRQGFHKQIIGSLLCFMYIFYWHGAEVFILFFIILNYAGLVLEKFGSFLCNITLIKHLETNVMSAAMVQRVHGFCSIPIFLISCFSVFCFFGGKEVSYLFFERLIVGGWIGSYAIMIFLLYCAIQNAIEVNRWVEARQKYKQA